jgi:hypothetical protein
MIKTWDRANVRIAQASPVCMGVNAPSIGGPQMVPNLTTILQCFTGEGAVLLQADAILTVCREIGYTAWCERVLTPITTVQLFLVQMLHGHTACSHLPHRSGLRFSAAAYCQARAKLPLHLFALLLEPIITANEPTFCASSLQTAI